MSDFDVVVIGAGAAGLFCAGAAGQRGLRVLLLDHAAKVAEKIRISGGGRSNFTNREALPQRLAHAWLHDAATRHPALQDTAAVAELKDKDLEALGQSANAWSITPSGTEGYAKAEVTAGGVDTRELSSQTMESKLQPGLYFIGEVVDVTGWLGGYNFQWAWSSAMACARAMAQSES